MTYVLQADYGYGDGWEDLTAEETKEEINQRRREYEENAPGVPCRVVRQRED